MALEETLDEMSKIGDVDLATYEKSITYWGCLLFPREGRSKVFGAPLRHFYGESNTPLEAATECLKRYKESVK